MDKVWVVWEYNEYNQWEISSIHRTHEGAVAACDELGASAYINEYVLKE